MKTEAGQYAKMSDAELSEAWQKLARNSSLVHNLQTLAVMQKWPKEKLFKVTALYFGELVDRMNAMMAPGGLIK